MKNIRCLGKLPKLSVLLIIMLMTAGCFFSEKQLSSNFNTGTPLPDLIGLTSFNKSKGGEWNKSTEYHFLNEESGHT